jgi:predicted transcriptional regulator
MSAQQQRSSKETAAWYRAVIKRGRAEVAAGETVSWEEVKRELDRQDHSRQQKSPTPPK